MTLSQLIARLQDQLTQHGDVEVILETPDDGEFAVTDVESFQLATAEAPTLVAISARSQKEP